LNQQKHRQFKAGGVLLEWILAHKNQSLKTLSTSVRQLFHRLFFFGNLDVQLFSGGFSNLNLWSPSPTIRPTAERVRLSDLSNRETSFPVPSRSQ
jgi:hypothetical protein